MKNKKQLSRKAYNILSGINVVLLIVTVLMFLAGLGGEGYWIHFGVTAGVYAVWAVIFSRFTLNDEDKKKDELKKQEKRELIELKKYTEMTYITDSQLKLEKERIEKEGLILCSEKDMANLIEELKKSYMYKRFYNHKCSICNAEIILDEEYVANISVTEDKVIDGVYVNTDSTGLVKQAHQHVTTVKEFPAIKYRCPHCEWELFLAAYTTLEYENFDSKLPDGESYIAGGYFNNKHIAYFFSKGKLYGKAPYNSRHNSSIFKKK